MRGGHERVARSVVGEERYVASFVATVGMTISAAKSATRVIRGGTIGAGVHQLNVEAGEAQGRARA